MTLKRKALVGLLALLPTGLLAGAVLNGPHHGFFPAAMGLTKVSPYIWTDQPTRDTDALLASAQEIAAQFWGEGIAPDRLIVCYEAPCAQRLGLRPLGLTIGSNLVLLAPKGANPTVLAHELSHVALHRYMGLLDSFAPRYPVWFNEGLAVHVSPDARYVAKADTSWIRAAQIWGDWSDAVNARGWPDTYGSAGGEVAALANTLGRDGLHALIAEVAEGADFDAVLSAMVAAP